MTNLLIPPKKIISLLLGMAMTGGFLYSATADEAQDSTVIAALSLNFARFTEWPASALGDKSNPIRLCVIGDNVIQQAFAEVDKKPVGDKLISVINMSRLKNVAQCQLLYVGGLDRNTEIQLLADNKSQPILTISSDNEHFLEDGGMVALNIVEGKVQMQINLNIVQKTGLKISSRVLKLATIVNP
jgi:hypothetical protein